MSSVAVVDYGMGNLRSVAKALEHVTDTGKIIVTSEPDEIAAADRVVFPGQGAAQGCMEHLNQLELVESIKQAARDKPFLGVCMGLQVLMTHSKENGGVDCMDMFAGEVNFFGDCIDQRDAEEVHKIPHMGWNNVEQTIEHPLWHGIKQNNRFYFVHSYFVEPEDQSIVAGRSRYGIPFVTSVARDNVFAVQFHPEKSAADGLQLLKNFVSWDGNT